MKVIIAGSRQIDDEELVHSIIEQTGLQITEVVSGNAKGVDTFGQHYAQKHGVAIVRFAPEWKRYKKAAGPIRNRQMAEYADALIAIPDKNSKGTWDMIKKMKKLGKKVFVYTFKD